MIKHLILPVLQTVFFLKIEGKKTRGKEKKADLKK